MKEKPKSLDKFKGMSWSRARRELDYNAHMLIFDDNNDPRAIRVAQSYRDFGLDVGMATLVATLYIQRYGAATAAIEAIRIYRGISKELREKPELGKKLKSRLDTLDFELGNMETWVYYASPNSRRDLQWPLKPEFKEVNDRGGMANIMLYLSMLEMSGDGGTTSLVAAQGIQRFMEKAIKHGNKK
jgi:hypothetical protein